MDEFSFASSGALGRTHYALVRKVEYADTLQAAEEHVQTEIETIRARLARPSISLTQVREYLVILLYCAMISPRARLHFALLHAVNLAEAGQTIQDKRTGYLFCNEIMPADHELQLMLVNTIRKDLEHPSPAHICLALDTLIISSSEDVLPAVQSRLHDLLSHDSPHVRRRALLAVRALSQHDSGILDLVKEKAQRRLLDTEGMVVHAALVLSTEISKDTPSDIAPAVGQVFEDFWSVKPDRASRRTLVHVLPILPFVGLSERYASHLTSLVQYAVKHHHHALLFAAFLALPTTNSDPSDSAVKSIRRFLTSSSPNDRYLFLSCLDSLDPATWAGTNGPPVLEEWEVERVMQQLDSKDGGIRKITLHILSNIDPNIVSSYYAQSLQGVPPNISLASRNEYALRLLEIVDLQLQGDEGGDGEYTRQLGEICSAVEGEEGKEVLESVVDIILSKVREGTDDFKLAVSIALVVSVCERIDEKKMGSTMMVLAAALACEVCAVISVSPVDVLRGFEGRLGSLPLSVQDACLLAMMRILALCEDEVPRELIEAVVSLGQGAGRHVRRRCEQFVFMAEHRDVLQLITVKAKSSSLPDFLVALEAHQALMAKPPRSPRTSSRPLSPRSPTKVTKLRYDVYEVPRPGSSRASSQLSVSTREGGDESLSRTVTLDDERSRDQGRGKRLMVNVQDTTRPDLIAFDSPFMNDPPFHLDSTPFAGSEPAPQESESLESLGIPASSEDSSSQLSDSLEDANLVFESTRASPYQEPGSLASSAHIEETFEKTWDAMEGANTRGWCELSMDAIVRKLQGLGGGLGMTVIPVDRAPFEGDLKVLVSGKDGMCAALRLKESEDEDSSCLWRMRCGDDGLRVQIKRTLSDG